MSYTIVAGKTFPHEPGYSPAVVDTATTLEEAERKYSEVRDYPYSELLEDGTEDNGDVSLIVCGTDLRDKFSDDDHVELDESAAE